MLVELFCFFNVSCMFVVCMFLHCFHLISFVCLFVCLFVVLYLLVVLLFVCFCVLMFVLLLFVVCSPRTNRPPRAALLVCCQEPLRSPFPSLSINRYSDKECSKQRAPTHGCLKACRCLFETSFFFPIFRQEKKNKTQNTP